MLHRSWDGWLVRAPELDSKVASLNPGWSLAEFSSPESTLRADSCSVSVPLPVLPQRHIKDPSLSAKSAGGRVHLNMHTPLTQRSQSELTLPLSRHSVGTYLETNLNSSCQETVGHSRLSPLSHCGLILA